MFMVDLGMFLDRTGSSVVLDWNRAHCHPSKRFHSDLSRSEGWQ